MEDDVEATSGDINACHELVKVYGYTMGNRGLIVKVFGVLIFLIVFMRFYSSSLETEHFKVSIASIHFCRQPPQSKLSCFPKCQIQSAQLVLTPSTGAASFSFSASSSAYCYFSLINNISLEGSQSL
jgi:hypothetical protein